MSSKRTEEQRKRRAKKKAAKKASIVHPGQQSTYARKVAGRPAPTSEYAPGGRLEGFIHMSKARDHKKYVK